MWIARGPRVSTSRDTPTRCCVSLHHPILQGRDNAPRNARCSPFFGGSNGPNGQSMQRREDASRVFGGSNGPNGQSRRWLEGEVCPLSPTSSCIVPEGRGKYSSPRSRDPVCAEICALTMSRISVNRATARRPLFSVLYQFPSFVPHQ